MSFITVTTSVDVDVEIDLDEEIDSMSAKDQAKLAAKLAAKLGGSVPFGAGDGDQSRANTIVERAYLSARQIADLPREIADLFWHVHGKAI